MAKTNKFYNIFEYICALLILLECPSVFNNSGHSISIFIGISSMIFIFLLFIISILRTGLEKVLFDTRVMMFFIIGGTISLIFLFIEYFFIYKFAINAVVPFFFSIFFFMTYFYFNDEIKNNGILKKITNIVSFLSISSLVFYVLYFFGLGTNVSLPNYWGTGFPVFNGYFYLDFISQVLPGTNIIRNSSVFAEPSIFGLVLISAMLIQIFIIGLNNKKDTYKIVLFIITIISTTSSTAIAIAIVILLVKVLLNSKRKPIITIFGFPLFVIGFIIVKWLYFSKSSKGLDIYSSYAVRSNDVYSCIQTWMHHIFLGVGIGNNNYIGQYMFAYRSITGYGLSTGFFAILAYGGVIMLLFYLIPSILTIIKSNKIFAVAFFINVYLAYAIVQQTYLIALFLGYFWAYVLSKKTGRKTN